MWNTGFGMGAGMWLVMGAGTVAFWVIVALVVRGLLGARAGSRRAAEPGPVGQPPQQQPGAEQGPSVRGQRGPLAVLQDRLASGEIDVDEYARIRRALVQSEPRLAADSADADTHGDVPRAS